MRKIKKPLRLLLVISFILIISFVNAEIQTLGDAQINEPIQLLQTCDNCSYINITTVKTPNFTIVRINQVMEKNGSDYNYTFTNTGDLGEYIYTTCGDVDGIYTCDSINFDVTNTGRSFTSGQGITGFGLLFGSLILSGLFMFFGINIRERSHPISFLFIVLSLFLGVYSLNLGWAFSHDIMEYESLSTVAEIIYLSVTWILMGVAILGMALMLISFIKEISDYNKLKRFGEDFDPLTNTY